MSSPLEARIAMNTVVCGRATVTPALQASKSPETPLGVPVGFLLLAERGDELGE
jgi:hypothetical protein